MWLNVETKWESQKERMGFRWKTLHEIALRHKKKMFIWRLIQSKSYVIKNMTTFLLERLYEPVHVKWMETEMKLKLEIVNFSVLEQILVFNDKELWETWLLVNLRLNWIEIEIRHFLKFKTVNNPFCNFILLINKIQLQAIITEISSTVECGTMTFCIVTK